MKSTITIIAVLIATTILMQGQGFCQITNDLSLINYVQQQIPTLTQETVSSIFPGIIQRESLWGIKLYSIEMSGGYFNGIRIEIGDNVHSIWLMKSISISLPLAERVDYYEIPDLVQACGSVFGSEYRFFKFPLNTFSLCPLIAWNSGDLWQSIQLPDPSGRSLLVVWDREGPCNQRFIDKTLCGELTLAGFLHQFPYLPLCDWNLPGLPCPPDPQATVPCPPTPTPLPPTPTPTPGP